MQLLRNREVKIAAAGLSVIFIFFILIYLYISNMWIKTANTINIRQNISAAGTILKAYPELEGKIVKSFTSNYTDNYEYGKEILKKYSYDEGLKVYKNTMFLEAYKNLVGLTIAVLLGFGIIIFLFFLLSYNIIFKKLRMLAANAEMVVEGSYIPVLTDKEEGDFGLLMHQFNIMAERLNENVEALKEEKLALKKLITDISHQLKTPLASLVMFNDIMIRDIDMAPLERKNFLQESKNQMDRVEWLIKNLLKMAKLEGKIVEFKKEEAPIYNTFLRSIRALELMALGKNVSINLKGSKDIVIKHDVNWSTEAFSNIIKNCIEHNRKGGNISVDWESNSIFSQITIEDSGFGINKKELPKIFDRFYKGPNSNNPTNIGIGLYIAKSIVEGQGGSIYALSEEGKGTKFVVTFMKNT